MMLGNLIHMLPMHTAHRDAMPQRVADTIEANVGLVCPPDPFVHAIVEKLVRVSSSIEPMALVRYDSA